MRGCVPCVLECEHRVCALCLEALDRTEVKHCPVCGQLFSGEHVTDLVLTAYAEAVFLGGGTGTTSAWASPHRLQAAACLADADHLTALHAQLNADLDSAEVFAASQCDQYEAACDARIKRMQKQHATCLADFQARMKTQRKAQQAKMDCLEISAAQLRTAAAAIAFSSSSEPDRFESENAVFVSTSNMCMLAKRAEEAEESTMVVLPGFVMEEEECGGLEDGIVQVRGHVCMF